MDAIEKLTGGYRRFRDGRFQETRALYEDLVDHGQSPKVAMVSCSDSRVDPVTLLQADPGDLFVVRNVANLVPPCDEAGGYHGAGAALEYAVQHLQVEHIVVLGHAHCGGIRSLFGEEPDGPSFIPPWMKQARGAFQKVQESMPEADEDSRAQACEQAAILGSLENLMTFPFIRERVEAGSLHLHGWYIDIRGAVLHAYDAATQRFAPVE